MLAKISSAFTHVLIINEISTDSTYLFILTVNADPKTEKYSANEKFICIKIQCNTRHKILSNCTCKILLNTCVDYLLEMRWGKNLLNVTAWKWTKRSDVVLSHWPIFTNSFNYLDIILLILKIQSTPHIILNTFTFLSLSLLLTSNCFSTDIPFKKPNWNMITTSIIVTVKDSVHKLSVKRGEYFLAWGRPFNLPIPLLFCY